MSNTKQKRSKFLIIIISIVLAILALGAIAVSFMLNYNTFAPNELTVLDDGENIYISTNMNDNYKGYRFKFIDENDKEIIIDSKNNQVSVNELLEMKIALGQTYKVSVCYLAENSGNNTEYSDEITWKCQNYLSMPIVNYDQTTSILSWSEVEGADFYRIYINGQENYIETMENTYNLQLLESGDKSINVVGYSNNENYFTSNKSNSLQIKLVHYLNPFTFITFKEQSKTITAKSTEEYQKINIKLNQSSFDSILFDVVKSGEEYIYTIDITTIYNGEELIGISPCSIDEYNVFAGDILYYQSTII